MAEDRAGQRESFTGRYGRRTHRMAKSVRCDTRQFRFGYHLGPQPLRALIVSLAGLRREHELRALGSCDRLEQDQRGRSQRADRAPSLAIRQYQQAALKIYLRPSQPGDLIAAATCQSPKPGNLYRFDVGTCGLQGVERLSETGDLIKNQETVALVVGFSDRCEIARVARNHPAPGSEAKDRGQVSDDLASCTVSATDNDSCSRGSLFVARRLAGADIANETLDFTRSDLTDALVPRSGTT